MLLCVEIERRIDKADITWAYCSAAQTIVLDEQWWTMFRILFSRLFCQMHTWKINTASNYFGRRDELRLGCIICMFFVCWLQNYSLRFMPNYFLNTFSVFLHIRMSHINAFHKHKYRKKIAQMRAMFRKHIQNKDI